MENLYDKASEILNQVKQAVVGKDDAIDNIFAAILAGGHILIEDMPGVGKTTMSFSPQYACDGGFPQQTDHHNTKV